MMRNMLIMLGSMALMGSALANGMLTKDGFPMTQADIDQVSAGYIRKVIVESIGIRTRPIAEAAVLSTAKKGTKIGVVSEGGGWATLDMGGGFLGWVPLSALSDVIKEDPSVVKKSGAAKIIPLPNIMPADLRKSVLEDNEVKVKRF